MALNFYERCWTLNEAACPCDVHFVSFLQERVLAHKSIFHFGTGAHHVVALENARLGLGNSILGITCSKQEYASYMDLVSTDSSLAVSYKAIYADAYTLSSGVLPEFDIVTLFHLGEYWNGRGDGMHGNPSAEAPLNDQGLFDLMWSRTREGGLLLFYRGSAGWVRTEPILERAIASGRIRDAGSHRTLSIYRKVGAGEVS